MDTTYGEGLFTSQAVSFVPSNTRTLPPPTSIPTPGGTGSGGSSSLPATTPQIRILGLSWTWFGEGMDTVSDSTKVVRTLWDYNTNTLLPASNGLERSTYDTLMRTPNKGITPTTRDVKPQVLLGIIDGATKYGPYDNDGFSAVRDVNGQIPVMQDPKNVKWYAQFKLGAAGLGTVLLATPYLDDVTVYWDDSRTHLLSYVFDNRTF
jgi:hypothetical protein